METSKFGNVSASAGLIFGIFYAMKKNKNLGVTTLYALGFGLVGMVVGNQISKFYEQ